MEPPQLCQFLDWDSTFFGRRIGRVVNHRLTERNIEEIFRWSAAESIDCLYYLADPSDGESLRIAQKWGFLITDVRITFERKLEDLNKMSRSGGDVVVRPSEEKDIPALRALARTNHRDTRFYYDPNFTDAQCSALYDVWMDKSCKGYSDIVLIADVGGSIGGYITCHLDEGHIGRIGLAGVKDGFRGKGLGTLLVDQALVWFKNASAEKATVVTQGRNIKAQRLYEQCGFFTRSLEVWFHRWFTPAHSENGR